MPFAASAALASLIPVPAEGGIYPAALALAALFGFLVTLAFALMPLGRARDVPATALFREMGFEGRGLPRLRLSPRRRADRLCARRTRHLVLRRPPHRCDLRRLDRVCLHRAARRRLARAVARPRAARVSARRRCGSRSATSTGPARSPPRSCCRSGLGLTLLVTLAMIDGDLRRQISGSMPKRAPNFFFVDIQAAEIDAFAALIAREAPQAARCRRCRCCAAASWRSTASPPHKLDVPPEGAWVLRGDRGLTYAETVPANASLTPGRMVAEGLFRRTARLLLGARKAARSD